MVAKLLLGTEAVALCATSEEEPSTRGATMSTSPVQRAPPTQPSAETEPTESMLPAPEKPSHCHRSWGCHKLMGAFAVPPPVQRVLKQPLSAAHYFCCWELLAVILGICHFRAYLYHASLNWLLNFKEPEGLSQRDSARLWLRESPPGWSPPRQRRCSVPTAKWGGAEFIPSSCSKTRARTPFVYWVQAWVGLGQRSPRTPSSTGSRPGWGWANDHPGPPSQHWILKSRPSLPSSPASPSRTGGWAYGLVERLNCSPLDWTWAPNLGGFSVWSSSGARLLL